VRHHRLVRPMPRLPDVRLSTQMEHVRPVVGRPQVLHQVVDRRLVRQIREHRPDPAAQMPEVVQRAARRRPHERGDVRAQLHERVRQMRPHEPVRARHEHRPACVRVAVLLPEPVGGVLCPAGGGGHSHGPRRLASRRLRIAAVRGWLRLYRTSVGVGLGYLARHGYLREAVVRVVVPLDPSRYLELPQTRRELSARPGERVLDLASPKVLAVSLAREGVEVTSVDLFPEEIAVWRKLVPAEPNLRLEVGDGRALPFEDAAFDHAYSVSVLEHIAEPGDEEALRELGRVVRPGGRVVLTLPFAARGHDELRAAPLYGSGERRGERYFFQRWYDEAR